MKRKRNKKEMLGYKSIRFFGKILRSRFDKNPLERVGKIPAYVYDKKVSPQLDTVAFKLNGVLGYKRGSNPTCGSIRYTLLRIGVGFISFGLFSAFLAFMSQVF